MVVAAQPLVPEPLRKHVILVNAQRCATKHHYVRSELVQLGAAKAYAFIFKCEVTGAERRFGIENPISRAIA